MRNLVLIGFMGTGKTLVGKKLAGRLKMEFVDTDELISKRFGISISRIFAEHGEPAFRKAEREVIAEVSGKDSQVIATGGGAVENPENMANLKKAGLVVCLNASPEVILERISGNNTRPLLNGKTDRMTRIKELLERRRPYYSAADVQIDTSHNNLDVTVEEILRYYREYEDSQS